VIMKHIPHKAIIRFWLHRRKFNSTGFLDWTTNSISEWGNSCPTGSQQSLIKVVEIASPLLKPDSSCAHHHGWTRFTYAVITERGQYEQSRHIFLWLNIHFPPKRKFDEELHQICLTLIEKIRTSWVRSAGQIQPETTLSFDGSLSQRR
jgi:hypothetical protein